ncbi:MAG TPA: hypothetical protein VK626_01555 [Nitrospiraceae bacterium]|nr:hypothetical protein [Nitrospiraceae bacterium]
MQLQLPIHSYQLRSKPASTARLVNCFAEQLPPDAKTAVLLGRTPGVTDWTTVGTGPIPPGGMLPAMGLLFVVSASKLYSVTANRVATLLGDVGIPGNIDMDTNGSAVVVVNEPLAYYWDGATFGQITDPDFLALGANGVEFDDNFMLFTEPNSDVFFGADLGSVTSFDALNFASAEGSPDKLRGLKVDHRQAILLGTDSLELWQNIGQQGFPFDRAANGFIEIGCFNAKTAVKLDNSVFWVANDYTVRRLDGNTPTRVSTHAVEQFLTTVTIASGYAYGYTQDGHLFYVLTFSEGTYVYDCTTKEWHERGTYGKTNWIAGVHAQAFGLELVGDTTSNRIGYLSATDYDEWGGIQRMEWTYQPVYAQGKRAFHHRLQMICEVGVGLTLGQGSDPQIMLDYSDDSGKTWFSMPNRSLGKIGNYRQIVTWDRLGSTENTRVYRGAVSDPVRVAITDTILDVEGGRV